VESFTQKIYSEMASSSTAGESAAGESAAGEGDGDLDGVSKRRKVDDSRDRKDRDRSGSRSRSRGTCFNEHHACCESPSLICLFLDRREVDREPQRSLIPFDVTSLTYDQYCSK
jgi:hypothetical protein